MIGEILATGDEIRSGALIDSNSAYIAQQLMDVGVEVTRHQCVGDDIDGLVTILNEIAPRADVAVVTGGLGPTADDLTARAAASAAGVDLELDSQALQIVETFFKTRGREMSEISRKQAFLPRGAECLNNPIGTAAGFHLRVKDCSFYFLPGVPREMRRMLTESVLPHMACLSGHARSNYRIQTISTFGLTESVTAERLAGFDTAFPDIRLGLRARFPEIQIRLYINGFDKNELQTRLTSAADWVTERMAEHVFSRNGQSMQAVIGDLLNKNRESLALAESCTGGLVAHLLTDVPGSSDYFLFSGVTYSNEAKQKVLGVSAETLMQYGAVHEQTAMEMAVGARQRCGATYGLSTSGIAGPGGGSRDKPVGTVCVGLAAPQQTDGYRFTFLNLSRRMNKEIFAMAAMDVLRRHLLGIKGTDS